MTQSQLGPPTVDDMAGRILDVVVVGGSQAGLAIAWQLARQDRRFVVLEAGPEVGHVWRSRWDSLKLFTPAQYDALPGMPFPAPVDTYPTKDLVADYLQAYVAAYDLPVRLNARVTSLTRTEEGFKVAIGDEVFTPGRWWWWWWPLARSRCRSSHRRPASWTTR